MRMLQSVLSHYLNEGPPLFSISAIFDVKQDSGFVSGIQSRRLHYASCKWLQCAESSRLALPSGREA